MRVSTEDQAESGLGLEAQLTSCRAMAIVKGWPEPHIYRDDGISGTKGPDGRPGLASLLADARAGALDAIIIKSLDRLGRRTRLVLELVDELAAAGVSLISCQEALDTTTPQGAFVLTIFAAIGQLERDQTAARTRAALAELRRRAGQAGGKLPYGYVRSDDGSGGVRVDPVAAANVRAIFAQRARRATLREIAATLPPPSPRGQDTWHHTAVATILAHEPTYRGEVRAESSQVRWPVILEDGDDHAAHHARTINAP